MCLFSYYELACRAIRYSPDEEGIKGIYLVSDVPQMCCRCIVGVLLHTQL